MKIYKIPLKGKNGDGKFTIVDKDTYEKYKDKNVIGNNHGYAGVCIKRKFIGLHRVVTDCPSGMVVDHKNHNRLDNRRSNLRICTAGENAKNRKDAKHYCWDNTHNYWRVEWKGITRCYHSEEEAKAAVKMIASGKAPEKRSYARAKNMRPKNISRNRLSGYFFQRRINGVCYRKYGFSTIKDAVDYRNKFYKEKGILI